MARKEAGPEEGAVSLSLEVCKESWKGYFEFCKYAQVGENTGTCGSLHRSWQG